MTDILIIGNPTVDYIDGNYFSPGGPVTYITNSLSQLGQSKITAVTSFGKDFSYNNFHKTSNVINIKSDKTNKFDFSISSDNRKMMVISSSNLINLTKINLEGVPDLIFIAPVLNEFSIKKTEKLMNKYKNSFFVGMPQGWIRKIKNKNVHFDYSMLSNLPFFNIVFFSEEEISDSKMPIERLKNLAKILVVTQGKNGAKIYIKDEIIDIPPFPTQAINTIGAGDIFASVFSLEFYKTKNLIYSGNLANKIAAKSTQYLGIESINSEVFISSP